MPEFIDCSSINVSFDIMGIATVSYTIVSSSTTMGTLSDSITIGGQTITGNVVSASMSMIPNTEWTETHVVLVGTTN